MALTRNRGIMIDFITPFYSQKHTEDSLLRGVDSLLDSLSNLQVRLFPVYIEPSLWNGLKEGTDHFRLLSENEGVFLFELSFTLRQLGKQKKITGKLFAIRNKEYPDIYAIVTIEDSLFFSRGVLPYFTRHYPRAALTFITHRKLKNFLANFRDKNNFTTFNIIRTTTYSRIDRKIVPSVNWPEFTLEKAFEWVADENGWFKNLTLKVMKPQGVEAGVSISRNGVIRTDKYFEPVYRDFILPISKIVYRNIEFFGKRARLDNPDRNIRPLCIDFGIEKFTEPEENQKFINAMSTMKASSLSIIHANPYLYLSIFDYFDGSSFDVWVLSPDKIIIVPQLKASFQSVKRLINHIFDTYDEGHISDYEVAYQ